ncbi:MAG: hypothetical protein ACTHOP_22240 [Mesorhizobium sp.]
MKIVTWNKLWSRTEKEQREVLARALSIHPFGRTEAYRQKNRVRAARRHAQKAEA